MLSCLVRSRWAAALVNEHEIHSRAAGENRDSSFACCPGTLNQPASPACVELAEDLRARAVETVG